MSVVRVTCKKFPAPYTKTNGIRRRDVSRRTMLRAIITVGAQRHSDVYSLGMRGFFHRFGVGLSAVSFLGHATEGLCVDHRFHELDMSEKGAMSYWHGMAMAKIVAESELGIPWLAHVDKMRDCGALITSATSRQRGDLVGRGKKNNWHVIEAKGRSNEYSDTLIASAKEQSSSVTSINGKKPATCSACITALHTRPISVLLEDPPPKDDGEGERWEINTPGFFEQYYRGIKTYLGEFGIQNKSIGNALFITAPLMPIVREYPDYPPMRYPEDWRLEIGLLKAIYDHPDQAPDAVADMGLVDSGKMGSDGIAIFG